MTPLALSIWGLVGPSNPIAGVRPGPGKVEQGPSRWHSALGNSAKRPLEWGLWGVTLGTAALCWGCCSCLGVISHSPLCLQSHPEQGGERGAGGRRARCRTRTLTSSVWENRRIHMHVKS